MAEQELEALRSCPIRACRPVLFTIMIWETLTTLGRESLAAPLRSGTLPGASALSMFDGIKQTTVVEMRLRLKKSLCTTTKG